MPERNEKAVAFEGCGFRSVSEKRWNPSAATFMKKV
jgi:hypothetical protein